MQSSVHLGSSVSVEAQVTGNPPPNVTWALNGEDASKGGLATVEADEDKHKLLIEHASLKHHGVYTVKAVNEGGEDRKKIQILVIGRY